jgi:nucleoside-diphosphate-sugar epimerase
VAWLSTQNSEDPICALVVLRLCVLRVFAFNSVMRVLIIGPGYVGLALGRELVRRGHEVSGLRRSGDASGELQAAGLHTLVGDITRPETLLALPSQFDWVVNCVSSSHGGAEDYRRIYLQGARNLIAWLERTPPAKFVHTSSTGVYGQNDGSLVDETAPTDPPNETSRVLIVTERVYLEAARQRNFPAVVLRVAGIYGPGRGWWLKQFLAGEARIEGEGLRTLNMIHRDDVAGCIIAALERGKPGEIYNAVDDEPVTQRDFFAWLAAKLNRSLPPSVSEDADASRKRGVTNKRITNRKLKAELGYAFRYPTFREGYAEEVDGPGATTD